VARVPIVCVVLAAAGIAAGGLSRAAAEPLDKGRYEAAIAAARSYAADQTLINYCLRGLGERGPNLFIWAHDNLEQAIQRLKAAGADPGQLEGLARVVILNVRFFTPDASDAALEPQCAAREVEKNVALLMGPGLPLHLRAPFRDFPS
jgi:hypothetical protein